MSSQSRRKMALACSGGNKNETEGGVGEGEGWEGNGELDKEGKELGDGTGEIKKEKVRRGIEGEELIVFIVTNVEKVEEYLPFLSDISVNTIDKQTQT